MKKYPSAHPLRISKEEPPEHSTRPGRYRCQGSPKTVGRQFRPRISKWAGFGVGFPLIIIKKEKAEGGKNLTKTKNTQMFVNCWGGRTQQRAKTPTWC